MAVIWSTWYLIGMALLFGLMAVGVFVYLVKKGYFTDIEEAKYSMFRHEEEDHTGESWN